MLVLYFDSYLVRGACFYLVKGVCLYLVRVIFYIYAECLSEVYFWGFYLARVSHKKNTAQIERCELIFASYFTYPYILMM